MRSREWRGSASAGHMTIIASPVAPRYRRDRCGSLACGHVRSNPAHLNPCMHAQLGYGYEPTMNLGSRSRATLRRRPPGSPAIGSPCASLLASTALAYSASSSTNKYGDGVWHAGRSCQARPWKAMAAPSQYGVPAVSLTLSRKPNGSSVPEDFLTSPVKNLNFSHEIELHSTGLFVGWCWCWFRLVGASFFERKTPLVGWFGLTETNKRTG